MNKDGFGYYEHIRSRCEIREDTDCWVFLPTLLPEDPNDKTWETKYAYMKYYGKVTPVMRVMYEESQGVLIPDGYEIRHRKPENGTPKCHRRCVNPDHLVLRTLMTYHGHNYKNTKPKPSHLYQKKDHESNEAANSRKNMTYREILEDFGVDPSAVKLPGEK